jgi:hypothetical protein
MKKGKEPVPRMKDTSQLEKELRAIESSSFESGSMLKRMMEVIKEDREAILFESGSMLKRMMEVIKEDREAILFEMSTFVLSPRDSSYSSQMNYIQGMRNRLKS